MIESALADATLQGLTQTQQLGLAGVFLSFIFIGGICAIWYFAHNCDKRTEASVTAFKNESAANRSVIEKNSEAFNGVQIALARIEVRIDKSN